MTQPQRQRYVITIKSSSHTCTSAQLLCSDMITTTVIYGNYLLACCLAIGLNQSHRLKYKASESARQSTRHWNTALQTETQYHRLKYKSIRLKHRATQTETTQHGLKLSITNVNAEHRVLKTRNVTDWNTEHELRLKHRA